MLTDLYVAYLNVPSIGRNLLGQARYDALMAELGPGNHAVMVLSAGPAEAPENPIGDRFVLGAVPDRLALSQGGLIVNARDMAVERRDAGSRRGPAARALDHPADRSRRPASIRPRPGC